jgi:hypothetical protein
VTFLRSIESLPSIRFSIRPEFAVILPSLWTADPNRIVPAFDPLVIPLLHAVGPVIPPVLPVLHSWRLGETRERTGEECRDDQKADAKKATWFAG